MDFQLWPGLVGGGIGSALFTVVIIASYLFAKEIWLTEVTAGEVPFEWSPKGLLWVAAILGVMFVGSAATAGWVAAGGGTFWESVLAAYWVQVAINTADLLFIDIALYIWIHPKFMQFDGVPPLEGYWPHVKGAFNGLIIGAPIALLSGALAWLA
ncbi:MAG: hypothetical protein AAGA48_23900 [Myxococcota bacterium]